MGAVGQLPALGQAQWTGLVNVPGGSTNIGYTLGSTAGLGQSEGQQDQSALQHSLSLGSLTLQPEQKLGKRSDLFSTLLLGHLPLTLHVSPFMPHVSRFVV